MKKYIIITFVVLLIAFLLPPTLLAAQRGIKVKARTMDGLSKDITLYSGYYALIIGCADYSNGWPRLRNPLRDAQKVEAALKTLGFTTLFLENPTSLTLRQGLNSLVSGYGSKKDAAIFVYYAGHGHTLIKADGKRLGYIVPVDTPDPDTDLATFMTRAVSMREVEEISALIQSRHVLMTFDCCFSGTIFRARSAKPSAFIRDQVARPVRAFITAGEENEPVPDESVFKTCLIQGLIDRYADKNADGYVTSEELGLYLKEEVVNYTNGSQHPQFGKINNPDLDKGDFVFVLGSGQPDITSETQRLAEERAKLERERRELEELKSLADQRKRLEEERKRVEAEKVKLAMAKRPTPPEAKKPGDIWKDPTIGMEFVWVPKGCFQMGSTSGDSDEKPVHEVCIDGFWMGKYEVTINQYRAFLQATGETSGVDWNDDDCPIRKGGSYSLSGNRFGRHGNQPMVEVSWHGAKAFCKWLSKETGKKFRLPTEAEWEYACRSGGRNETYAGGNDVESVAWYGNSGGSTHRVGTKAPNGLGIYDMSGNVWEWCEDWYGKYPSGSVTDPTGPSSGSDRVFRGGGWYGLAWSCRSANRFRGNPDYRYYSGDGFRVARDL